MSVNYDEIIREIQRNHPTLPTIVNELTNVLQNPDASTFAVEEVMTADQSMTMKILLVAVACCCFAGARRVETALGALDCQDVGIRSHQCLGIPFAAPPVGALRWKPPAPVAPWLGVLDATKKRPICLQANKLPVAGSTSEDW